MTQVLYLSSSSAGRAGLGSRILRKRKDDIIQRAGSAAEILRRTTEAISWFANPIGDRNAKE